MTAAEGSYLGFARQTGGKGSGILTDANFKYLLFRQGQLAPAPMTIPLDAEIGGGAMIRSMVKAGVSVSGAVNFIPRPESLGFFLYGMTGSVSKAGPSDSAYTHTFKMAANQFSAPYYTVRYSPGGMWGEEYIDCRFSALALEFRAANYVSGTIGFSGITPEKQPATGSQNSGALDQWGATARVDSGPQFVTAVSASGFSFDGGSISEYSILGGSLVCASNMPMDEQYSIGSYYPADMDIVSRSFMISLLMKVTDEELYTKLMYSKIYNGTSNPVQAWVANILKGNFSLTLKSDQNIGAGSTPYSLTVATDTGTGDNSNVYWSATPIALRAQRQVVMNLTGLVTATHANSVGSDPITFTLVNGRSSDY
jgi:hypothetical protein